MLKKPGIFIVILSCFLGLAKAADGGHFPVLSDTTGIVKDTLSEELKLAAPADPKDGFKELFSSTTSASNGITIEQLNPLAIGFVQDYVNTHGKKISAMKDWGKPYFDMMDVVLTKHGLPKQLKYLAVIESQLKSNARSWAGAVGPWQFMAGTARNLGLRVNKSVDERKDIYKSTHAASRYLTNLFAIYGDWLLVIAAYNGGPGKVNAAIKKSGSRDFWKLQKFLPAESRKHVKKFIATHFIFEGEGGITTLTKAEAGNFLLASMEIATKEMPGAVMQLISGRYNSAVIVKYLEMDMAAFNKINPNFDKEIGFNGKYELRLPGDKMDIFLVKKSAILNESIQLLLNGETVASGTY